MRKVSLKIITTKTAIVDTNELKCSSECLWLNKLYGLPYVCELRVPNEQIEDGNRTKFCLRSEQDRPF